MSVRDKSFSVYVLKVNGVKSIYYGQEVVVSILKSTVPYTWYLFTYFIYETAIEMSGV